MRNVQSAVVAIVVAVSVAGGVYGLAQAGERQQAPAGGEVGRYQFYPTSAPIHYVLDTSTGDLWAQSTDGKWRHLGNPAVGEDAAPADER